MLVRIANEPRDYAWGSTSAIADYLGTPPTGRPQAELWLGAHPTCPAKVDGRGLDEVLAEAGLEQPRFLLKLLAAAAPLSLQAHPDAEQAAEGFAREEAAGVPRDAATRTYRDPSAKPELVVAVTRFEALSGFRPVRHSMRALDALALLDNRVRPFATAARSSVQDAVRWMLAGDERALSVVHGVVEGVERLSEAFARERDTVHRLAAAAPGDPAIPIALLLHRVSLEPGQALFLPAGNLHAYLEGLAVELMGQSDNVVRGGLTQKHVDRDELLRILDFTEIDEPRVPAEALDGAVGWRPDAPFALRRVTGQHTLERTGQLIILAAADTEVRLRGRCLFLRRGEGGFAVDGSGASIASADAWVASPWTPLGEHIPGAPEATRQRQ